MNRRADAAGVQGTVSPYVREFDAGGGSPADGWERHLGIPAHIARRMRGRPGGWATALAADIRAKGAGLTPAARAFDLFEGGPFAVFTGREADDHACAALAAMYLMWKDVVGGARCWGSPQLSLGVMRVVDVWDCAAWWEPLCALSGRANGRHDPSGCDRAIGTLAVLGLPSGRRARSVRAADAMDVARARASAGLPTFLSVPGPADADVGDMLVSCAAVVVRDGVGSSTEGASRPVALPSTQ